MKIRIYSNVPKRLREPFSAVAILRELMGQMREKEVATIEKKDWYLTVNPARLYATSTTYHGSEYTFSLRQDAQNFYLMKVKNPISYQDKNGNWHIRNEWADSKITYKIIKKDEQE